MTVHSTSTTAPRTAIVRWLVGALTVATPLALWASIGNPLPSTIPSVTAVSNALTHGAVTDRTLVKVLAVVCWIAWSQLALGLVAELAERLRRRPLPPLPVHRTFRSLAALVVAGSGVGLHATVRSPGEPPLRPLRAALAAAWGDPASTLEAGSPSAPTTTPPTDAGATSGRIPTPASFTTNEDGGAGAEPPVHVVVRRDTLWKIAESRLGDPLRWPEIYRLNEGRQQPDGRQLRDPDQALQPGWQLVLPVDARPTPDLGAPGAASTVEVEPADTLWKIAESRLGDPLRWPEIYRLNEGRQQPDGRQLRDPDVIHPGWTLDLPGATADSGPTDREPDPPSPKPPAPTRTTSSSTSSTSSTTTTSPPPAPTPATEPTPRSPRASSPPPESLPPTSSSTAPRTARLEATPTTAAVRPAATPTTAATPMVRPEATPTTAATPATSATTAQSGFHLPRAETWPDESVDPAPAPEAKDSEITLDGARHLAWVHTVTPRARSPLVGAEILAAGVVVSIDRRRSRRLRRRAAGDQATEPEGRERAFELALRSSGAQPHAEATELVLRALAARSGAARAPIPPVIGVNVADELSLLFAEPAPEPVEGFSVEDDGYSWVIDLRTLDATLRSDATGTPHPFPTLVTLGHTTSSQVLLNLEAVGILGVRGGALHVQEVLFSMALELVTGSHDLETAVVLVGFGHELESLPGVRVVESPDSALETLASEPSPTAVILSALPVSETSSSRGPGLGSRPGTGPILVAAGDPPGATWHVDVDTDDVDLHPVGVKLCRHRLQSRERELLARMLRDPTPRDPAQSRTALESEPAPTDTIETDERTTERGPVEVCVLGTVETLGTPEAFPRRKAVELVTYLAFHREGVDIDTLSEALWPDRLTSSATIHSIASMARRILGSTDDGRLLLPHVNGDGRYRLREQVTLDAERFEALVARSRRRQTRGDRAGAFDDLTSALRLVRGRPFTVPGGEYLWAHAEALSSSIVALVTDAAHELASLALDVGDTRTVWWATQQGLLACPGNELLHRDRMVAADAQGNPAAVHEIVDELCRALEIEPEDRDRFLHPETVALYRRLSRHRTPRPVARGG